MRGREDLVRSMHVAVKNMQAAADSFEGWRRSISIPAEKSLYNAVRKQDDSQLPTLKVSPPPRPGPFHIPFPPSLNLALPHIGRAPCSCMYVKQSYSALLPRGARELCSTNSGLGGRPAAPAS